MAPAGWVCVPADSSHPRGPRRARGASALMVPSSGLLRTEGEAGGVGARLAACCPACPQPREQTFRPQGIALMSPESRDDRRPGVREQGWEFFITIRRASLCSLQVAAGCPASQRKSVVEMHSLLLAGSCLSGGARCWPPTPPPHSFPSSPAALFKGILVVIFIPFKKAFLTFLAK